jgi:hypothetical protein
VNREDLPQAKLGNLRRCGSVSAVTAWAISKKTASFLLMRTSRAR